MKTTEEKLLFAMDYATRKHQGQFRKYTKEPYITHPFAVAGLVASCPVSPDVVSAAFLHDVLEDCPVTLRELRGVFGPDIAQLVNSVTDISLPLDGRRIIRKRIDRGHLEQASPDGKTIKLADIINNLKNIAEHDWEFAKVYFAEKKLTLPYLRDGDAKLFKVATEIIKDYYEWMEVCDE